VTFVRSSIANPPYALLARLAAELRAEVGPLASRSALSWRVPFAFVPLGLASQLFADAARHGGSVVIWLLVALLGCHARSVEESPVRASGSALRRGLSGGQGSPSGLVSLA
jgi:hypothetical protein